MNKKGIEWITDILGDSPYEELDIADRMAFKMGQIYWTPIKYPFTPPIVLKTDKYDPTDESKTTFMLCQYNVDDTSQQLPIKSMKLRSDDRLFILQGKKRLAIVLGACETNWGYNHILEKGKEEKLVLCLPIFPFKNRHDQKFIIDVQKFDYPNYFYIIPSPGSGLEEGAARLELIQPIHKGDMQPYKSVNEKPLKLSDSLMKMLVYHISRYFALNTLNELDDDLNAYRQIINEKLKSMVK